MALEAQQIVVEYGSNRVLDEVSVFLEEGQRAALLGASGSGKSTLLRVLCGLLNPTAGNVKCDGAPIVSHDKNGVTTNNVINQWPKVTLVFQDLRLFPNLTARGNCLLGLNAQTTEPRLEDFSNRLEVSDCLSRRPSALSQGEMQRVAIIRALLHNPRYLLLDEPTSALDQNSRKRLVELLEEESSTKGAGLLFVTHDLFLASELATVAWFMRDGKLSESIEPRKVASLF